MKPLEVFMSVEDDENLVVNSDDDEEIGVETSEVIRGASTSNYNDLDNLPKINSHVLKGNKNGNELGLINSGDSLGISEIDRMFAAVFGN